MGIDIRTGAKSNEDWIADYRRVHGDLYDYPNVSYKSTEKIDVLCMSHGLFPISPSNHRAGRGCPFCAKVSRSKKQVKTNEQIIIDFEKKHNNRYNYNLVVYENARTKVNIICSIHGIFEQTPNCHLSGKGCPKCARENHKGSWTNTSWETSAYSSSDFDSFKVYILKLKNEYEEFIKIGKTFRTISKRVAGKNKFPYIHSEIQIFEFTSARDCSKFEIELHNIFNKYKYKPLIKFGGMNECYELDSLFLLKEYGYNGT